MLENFKKYRKIYGRLILISYAIVPALIIILFNNLFGYSGYTSKMYPISYFIIFALIVRTKLVAIAPRYMYKRWIEKYFDEKDEDSESLMTEFHLSLKGIKIDLEKLIEKLNIEKQRKIEIKKIYFKVLETENSIFNDNSKK